MQALGPMGPTDPNGSVQDRQVTSLHDRVSSELVEKPPREEALRENELEDNDGAEISAASLSLPSESPFRPGAIGVRDAVASTSPQPVGCGTHLMWVAVKICLKT